MSIKPLLLSDEPGTRSIYNVVFGVAGARTDWIRVDDLNDPQAVICRSGGRHRRRMLHLYATGAKPAERVISELPKPWYLEFAASPQRFVPVARKVLAQRNAELRHAPQSPGRKRRVRRINWVSPCYLYVLDPPTARPIRARPRPGEMEPPTTRDRGHGNLVIDRTHRVGTLRIADVSLVTKYWPHGRNQDYVSWRIRAGPTCAVRVKGKLAAWALTHADGAMGMLHVLDQYRGQGMARSITTALAQRCLKAGIKPFLYVIKKNQASIRLTESMGFTKYGIYCWFGE